MQIFPKAIDKSQIKIKPDELLNEKYAEFLGTLNFELCMCDIQFSWIFLLGGSMRIKELLYLNPDLIFEFSIM